MKQEIKKKNQKNMNINCETTKAVERKKNVEAKERKGSLFGKAMWNDVCKAKTFDFFFWREKSGKRK